ncbi:hypothetical protein ACFXPX_11100 [Kitasatospora sp. NPDC059146]|uniref:hypothetical protein n=1 Tax=Kitasatospora sp. NPDC059146 TaxID=3346741 RepID=UPI003674D9D0
MTMPTFNSRAFELVWPRWIAAAEIDRLMALDASGRTHDWAEQCTLFLTEAFTSAEIADKFEGMSSWTPWEPEKQSQASWLDDLRTNLDDCPTKGERMPYWSARRGASRQTSKTDLPATCRRFASLVARLDDAGYFASAMGQPCVDDSTIGSLGTFPIEELHRQLGREGGLWPVQRFGEHYDLDDLCDVIEFLADHVRRPTRRHYHSYSNCGWHYDEFDSERGQQLYRSEVNALLAESEIGLMLAESGRLEMVAPGVVEELVTAVRAAENVHDADDMELEHALSQFRIRGASPMDRRQSVIALAGILERRRALIKTHLLSKDEGALFQIANQFGIRHQDAKQQTEYDSELYLEWIFYWYVATINLTNKVAAAQV